MGKRALTIVLFVLIITFSVHALSEKETKRYIVQSYSELEVVEGVGLSKTELLTRDGIIRVEKDYKFKILDETPWNFQVIGINFSEIGESFGHGVKIAVLDTGVNYNLLNVSSGYDFVNEDGDAWDDNGHGTMVSQILKWPGTDLPLVGAEIYAVKVLDENGEGYAYDIIEGIEWAVDNDIDIVLMSLGGENDSYFLKREITEAYNLGVLFVAATGNEGQEFIMFPAAYDSVIATGSVNENLQKSGFSNYGEELELMAPGENILVTDGQNQFIVEGTSFSVPHVGVVVASLFSQNPGISNEEVRTALKENALDLGLEGKDNETGWGLVQYVDESLFLDMTFLPSPSTLSFGKLTPGQSRTVVSNLTVGNSSLQVMEISISSGNGSVFSEENVLFSTDNGTTFVSGREIEPIIINPGESFDLYVKLNVPVGMPAQTFNGRIVYTVAVAD